MACQVSNGQFCHINTPCMQQTPPSPVAMPYSSKVEIKEIHFAPSLSSIRHKIKQSIQMKIFGQSQP